MNPAKSNSIPVMRIIISDATTGELIREHDATGAVVKEYARKDGGNIK